MKKYKLTTQDLTTHNGYAWKIGVEQVIATPGTDLCSSNVFHFYDSPEIAVLMNPIHADIANPRLWEVEIDAVVAHDGTKGGAKKMTLIRELPLPDISIEYRVEFAINCALSVYKTPDFSRWAENWLSGKDRSDTAAREAAEAAAWAAWAAREAAEAWENYLIQFLPKKG